jgi:hypothetical protein
MLSKGLNTKSSLTKVAFIDKAVDSNLCATNSLTDVLIEMNRIGEFNKLTEIYESHQSTQPTNSFDSALAARAYLVEGQTLKFQSTIKRVNSLSSKNESLQSLLHLIKSYQLRQQKKWTKALLNAQKAKILAKRDLNYDFYFDAIFAQAIIATETGSLYKAINYYDQIIDSSRSLDHRKSLSLANKASLLWTLGQIESLKYLVPKLDENRKIRFQFFTSALDLDKVKVIEYVGKTLQSKYEPIELTNILKVLLSLHQVDFESQSVYKSLCEAVVEHINKYEIKLREPWVLESFHAIINNQKFIPSYDNNWRENISKAWLKAISDKENLTEIYEQEINPLNLVANANYPFYPDLNFLFNSNYRYHQKMKQLLKEKMPKQALSNEAAVQKLILQDKTLMQSKISDCLSSEKLINLSKNPQSLKLLSKLAGTKGLILSKAELHNALSQNKYAPHLHDDRLRKLISRLKSLVQKEFGFEIFCWNGLGQLELLCNIETNLNRS